MRSNHESPPLRELSTWPDIHQAAGHHPYVLAFGSVADTPAGFAANDAVAWLAERPTGRSAVFHGAARAESQLLQALHTDGVLGPVRRIVVSRETIDLLPRSLSVAKIEDWDFLWTTEAPPPQPGEAHVRKLDLADNDEINSVLDASLPASIARPGHPGVRAWHGIREDGQLVACAADFSRGIAATLAGIAVHPDAQGRGLGAALTSRVTRDLLAERGPVGLGVYRENLAGIRLYTRLGYTNRVAKSTVSPPGC